MSDRDAFRAEQQERRRAGKAKQHEKRLERAVRKQVAEEIAQAIGGSALHYPDWQQRDAVYDMERLAREIGSRDPA